MRFGHVRRIETLVPVVAILAGCASVSAPPAKPAWLDAAALQSCLAIRIPPEMIRDRNVKSVSVSLELMVLPSGRIGGLSLTSDSESDAFDNYLADRLISLPCAPFAPLAVADPYPVNLDLQIEVRK